MTDLPDLTLGEMEEAIQSLNSNIKTPEMYKRTGAIYGIKLEHNIFFKCLPNIQNVNQIKESAEKHQNLTIIVYSQSYGKEEIYVGMPVRFDAGLSCPFFRSKSSISFNKEELDKMQQKQSKLLEDLASVGITEDTIGGKVSESLGLHYIW